MKQLDLERLRGWLQKRRHSRPLDIGELRRRLDEGAATELPQGMSVRPELIGDLKVEWLAPAGEPLRSKALLYIHGGGFVAGSCASHRHLAAAIAQSSGVPAAILEYRLAPEHPFPAGRDDVVAAIASLEAKGFGPGDLAIVGDSAGAGLIVDAIQTMRDEGARLPVCAVLMSPWLDLTLSGPSLQSLAASDPTLEIPVLRDLAVIFDSGRHGYSPLSRGFGGLPPLLVQVGSDEILYDDAARLAEAVRGAGGEVRLEVGEGLFHVYQAFVPGLSEARQAVARIGCFVKEHLSAR